MPLRIGRGAVGELLAAALDIAERHDGLDILGVLGGDALEDLDRLVAAVGGIEIGRELDLRIALQRRIGRHALIDLDRHLRLLDRFIEIGERQQRHRMAGLQIERELQIDQREILAAAAGQRGADAVQRLGRAGLRGIDQRRQLLAGLDLAQALQHQRMPRQLLVERLVDRGCRRRCPCCATASAHRRRRRAAWNRRACRRARAGCRLPSRGWRDRGSCRSADP